MNALNGVWSNSADHHLAKIAKSDKDFAKTRDF